MATEKTKDKTSEPKPAAAPRRMASPDIQALAKMDRILAAMDAETAFRTVTFLTDKYTTKFQGLALLPCDPELGGNAKGGLIT